MHAEIWWSKFGGQNFVVRRDWYSADREGSTGQISWSDGTGTQRIERVLRVEGEFTLPSICDDLFAWSSLLQRCPAPHCLLQILNKFPSAQRPAGMRALANDGQPRFRLPCAEAGTQRTCSSHCQCPGILIRPQRRDTGTLRRFSVLILRSLPDCP
jgi:hypothetical protein